MNNQRRREINKVKRGLGALVDLNGIDKFKEQLENILSEEEFAFDNMPENLQDSMRGEDSQDAQDSLSTAIDILEDAETRDDIEEAISELDNIM